MDPELITAYGQLYDKLQRGVHFPPARSESHLLPLVPESTVFYAAIPNYGEAAQEALILFHDELQQNAVLRDWWRKDVTGSGPKVEDYLQTFQRLAQYLGDEIVISAQADGSTPGVLLLAPIKKPGLKAALQQTLIDATAKVKSKPGIRIVDVQELAAQDTSPDQDLVVLVRPDYLVAGSSAATVRAFNSRLDANQRGFTSTPFGQRVARAYQDGVTVLAAADLQKIVQQALAEKKQDHATLQRTGFGDVQYMVWEHTKSAEQDVSLSELSFTGPRRGIASWLGAPAQLGSLDFASPNAVMALSFVLANPAQLFDDLRELATSTDPKAFDGVIKMQEEMKVSLQQDFLRLLTGEVTLEVDSISETGPVWKAILRVNDPVRLQQTLTTMLAAQNLKTEKVDNPGGGYYQVILGSGKSAAPIAYTFSNGYWVIASSPDTLMEAVRLHRSGESLGKSPRFLASLPANYSSGVSGLMYQDPSAIAALSVMRLAPSMADKIQGTAQTVPPAVMVAYGEESAIRSASTSSTMDAGVVMMIAAVAIPNLLRSRTAANETSAVANLRVVNVSQVIYASTYPDRGFAPDLETLGPASDGSISAEHAGLIEGVLGCAGGSWCEKSGYRFRITAACLQGQCPQYIAVATPINVGGGSRNFCSTSDGVVRFKVGPPLTTPIRATECKGWQPLQ